MRLPVDFDQPFPDVFESGDTKFDDNDEQTAVSRASLDKPVNLRRLRAKFVHGRAG